MSSFGVFGRFKLHSFYLQIFFLFLQFLIYVNFI